MDACDFEPVVLGLDKRETDFSWISFTVMRSGQRSALCAVSALEHFQLSKNAKQN